MCSKALDRRLLSYLINEGYANTAQMLGLRTKSRKQNLQEAHPTMPASPPPHGGVRPVTAAAGSPHNMVSFVCFVVCVQHTVVLEFERHAGERERWCACL